MIFLLKKRVARNVNMMHQRFAQGLKIAVFAGYNEYMHIGSRRGLGRHF